MVAVLIVCCCHTRQNLVILVVRVLVVHVPTRILCALAAAKHVMGMVVWTVHFQAVVVLASTTASVGTKIVMAAHRPAETIGATSAAVMSHTQDDVPCNGAGDAAAEVTAVCVVAVRVVLPRPQV